VTIKSDESDRDGSGELHKEEGIFCGIFIRCEVVAAIKLAKATSQRWTHRDE